MIYLHGLSHNDPTAGVTTALLRQVHHRAVLSAKPVARLKECFCSDDPDIQTLITEISTAIYCEGAGRRIVAGRPPLRWLPVHCTGYCYLMRQSIHLKWQRHTIY